jgi:hypothetical protein
MSSDSFFIPHLNLDKNDKNKIKNLLVSSNLVLKKHHEKVDQTKKKISRQGFFSEILKKYSSSLDFVEVRGIKISKEDAEVILKIKKVEWRILQGYSRLLEKLSRKWSKNSDPCLSLDDIRSEAVNSAIKSIVHYSKLDVELCTFLYLCVDRHLARFCNKTNGMSHLTLNSIDLKRRHDELSLEEGSNFDSIVKKMNISEKEVSTLCSVLNKVQNVSSLSKEDQKEICAIDSFSVPEFDLKMMEVVSKIKLSELEKAVLQGFLDSSNSRLGLSSCSKGIINPDTNKPYSRMAFSLAWKRIKKKIEKEYKKVA